VTLVSLAIASSSLKQTQREIDLSRREVEEAHRPVVVPVSDHRLLDAAYNGVTNTLLMCPKTTTAEVLTVPVENIGSGPALQIRAVASPSSSDHPTQAMLSGLAANGKAPLDFAIPKLVDDQVPDFQLSVTYEDVAGKTWVTLARYAAARTVYEDIEISAPSTFQLGDAA